MTLIEAIRFYIECEGDPYHHIEALIIRERCYQGRDEGMTGHSSKRPAFISHMFDLFKLDDCPKAVSNKIEGKT